MKMKKIVLLSVLLGLALALMAGLGLAAVAEATDINTPLTLEAKTAGTIVVSNPPSGMQYSINGGTKTAVTSTAINAQKDDTVQFYGNGASASPNQRTTITGGTAECYIYGNIMSLVDETEFSAADTVAENAFSS